MIDIIPFTLVNTFLLQSSRLDKALLSLEINTNHT